MIAQQIVKEHMRPVATIAAAHLRTVPNFQAMQVPHGNVKVAVLVQDANAVSIDARGKNIRTKAAARNGLKATATRAHTVLRFLDAQVKSAAADDPKTLAAWKSAKRIGKGKVVPIEATIPPSTTSPTPTPTEAKAA